MGAGRQLAGVLVMNWDIAACKGKDPLLFYPEACPEDEPDCPPDDGLRGGTVHFYDEGKKICAVCPIKEDCRNHALDNKERYGLWGGLSPLERRRIERKDRRQRLKERRANESYDD